MQEKRKKFIQHTQKSISPTTIYEKQRSECAMITYTLKHTHTHTHTHTHKLTCVWREESARKMKNEF